MSTTTDENGHFSFDVVATRSPYVKLDVDVSRSGYGSWRLTGAALRLVSDLEVTAVLTTKPQTEVALPPEEQPSPKPEESQPETPTVAATAAAASASACSGYTSNYFTPPVIRVWRKSLGESMVRTYDFNFYVKHVLPSEWVPSFPFDALRAGSVATQTYGWHWVNTWRGGSINGACYDVDDTTSYQIFKESVSDSRTNNAIDNTWNWIVWKSEAIFDARYQRTLTGNTSEACGAGKNGAIMSQYGTRQCANAGLSWRDIVTTYYYPSVSFRLLGPLGAVERGDFNGDGLMDLAVGVPGESVGSAATAGAVNVLYGSTNGVSEVGSQIWYQGNNGLGGGAEQGDRFGSALAAGDFDGNGYTDLAVGIPGEKVGATNGAGAIHILNGSGSGLSASGNTIWSKDSSGIFGGTETGDYFGRALAVGDFNGDARSDLAIGVPGENIGGSVDAGAMNIIYGNETGLSATSNQLLYQGSGGVEGTSDAGDLLGLALVSSDLGNGSQADLGVGVPGESIGPIARAGAINVLYGAGSGLSTTTHQLWSQDSTDVAGGSETGDFFGAALAAGDIDSSGLGDLAVGVPTEDIDAIVDGGAMNVIYGGTTGLTSLGNQFWSQDSAGVQGSAEALDYFGWTVRSGDVGLSGAADVAVGVPLQNVGALVDAGEVAVLYGAATGLSDAGNQLFSQNTPGIAGGAEALDLFGSALSIGELGNGVMGDLAVGVALEDLVPANTGALNTIYGDPNGGALSVTSSQFWSQDSAGIPGVADAGDLFG